MTVDMYERTYAVGAAERERTSGQSLEAGAGAGTDCERARVAGVAARQLPRAPHRHHRLARTD